MSKKIDSALKDLIKALRKHADAVGERRVSSKKSQRASAKVSAAAAAYAEAVHARSGLGNPFTDMIQPSLEPVTLDSLAAERDSIARNLTGPIPQQQPEQQQPQPQEPQPQEQNEQQDEQQDEQKAG